MTALFTLLASLKGVGGIVALVGGLAGGLPFIGFFTKHKKLILIAAGVVVLIGGTLIAVGIHAAKVRSYGAERYAAGQADIQMKWDKAVADAAAMRAAEERRASEELSMRDLAQMQVEDADATRFKGLDADLQKALDKARADDPSLFDLRIPGELLRPRRSLNPGAP